MPVAILKDRRIHCEWRGAAPPGPKALVFLHDGLGAVGSWRAVPEQIADRAGLPALVFDRLGYGRSSPRADFPFGFMEAEVEPLRELLDGLGVERGCLIGHSDGGSIALLFAVAYPARAPCVVTEAAHVFVERETQAGIQALVDLQEAGQTPAWLAKLHGVRGEDVLRAWSRGWLTAEHARWTIERPVGGVRCPLLVIQGDRDEFGTLAQVEAILRQAPQGERWVAPGCGHTPHAQAEGDFVARVAEFVARQRP
jgi:pimeloyl-ACP methyl ester carboxylesterase